MLYIRVMTTLHLEVPDEVASRIKEAAVERGLTVEQLVATSIEEKLARDSGFESVVDSVLAENAELYKRLA
jgi:predicted transcriptional regulator